MRFKLAVDIGNYTSIEYYQDVCSALIYTVADIGHHHPEFQKPDVGDSGEILDRDGHKIGSWGVVEVEEEDPAEASWRKG